MIVDIFFPRLKIGVNATEAGARGGRTKTTQEFLCGRNGEQNPEPPF